MLLLISMLLVLLAAPLAIAPPTSSTPRASDDDVALFQLTSTPAAGEGAALSAVLSLEQNRTATRGFLPAGEVISNGGGGVHAASQSFALVTSRLDADGSLLYRASAIALADGTSTDVLPLPEVRYVLWDGFGIRAAVDQRAAPRAALAVLAPTSNCTGDPCLFEFGVFSVDFNGAATRLVRRMEGTPISAGGAATFDSDRGRFWFVLGSPITSARHLYAVDMVSGELVVDRPLLQPPGLTLLGWDATTADLFGVGVAQAAAPGGQSSFAFVRIDGDTGEQIAEWDIPEGRDSGWTSLRLGNIAVDARQRKLMFLVGSSQSTLNFLTLVSIDVHTRAVEQVPSFCRTGAPNAEYRNCPLLIGQASTTEALQTADDSRRQTTAEEKANAGLVHDVGGASSSLQYVSWYSAYEYYHNASRIDQAPNKSVANLQMDRNLTFLLRSHKELGLPGMINLRKSRWCDQIWNYPHTDTGDPAATQRPAGVSQQHHTRTPPTRMLSHGWEAAVDEAMSTLLPLTQGPRPVIQGIMLGDELVEGGFPLSNLSALATRVRRGLKNSSAFIYTNEAFAVGGRCNTSADCKHPTRQVCTAAHTCDAKPWPYIPHDIDFISSDQYATGTREAEVTEQYYKRFWYPLLRPHQRVWVCPGMFGPPGSPAQMSATDLELVAKLQAYWQWSKRDPRVAGMIGWHWSTLYSTFAPSMRLGAAEYPRTKSLISTIVQSLQGLPSGQ